jgi:triosephosphate isomerase (TIM)
MRKTIIAGNWKMYKTITEAIELANGLKREFFKIDYQKIDIVVCPPFTALSEVSEIIADSGIELGGQDVHWEDEGAFTGEISCKILKDAGCKFVIIGHSERRLYFQENNESVNKKIKAALLHCLTPIFCVGETLSERESSSTFKVLETQVQGGLKDINETDALKIVIAYEPVWAIGTGKTATPEQAESAQKYIRDLLKEEYNKDVASAVRIQYGGSVKPENISGLMAQPDIDGALVGGASLAAGSFGEIVRKALEGEK